MRRGRHDDWLLWPEELRPRPVLPPRFTTADSVVFVSLVCGCIARGKGKLTRMVSHLVLRDKTGCISYMHQRRQHI
jgi:hypothetical protein